MSLEKAPRNLAVDTYRGFVMLLMMAEVVQLSRVANALPGSGFWSLLAYHQTHVEWAGCSLHDTIQPGFSFLVGVALPYSIAARIAKGEPVRHRGISGQAPRLAAIVRCDELTGQCTKHIYWNLSRVRNAVYPTSRFF